MPYENDSSPELSGVISPEHGECPMCHAQIRWYSGHRLLCPVSIKCCCCDGAPHRPCMAVCDIQAWPDPTLTQEDIQKAQAALRAWNEAWNQTPEGQAALARRQQEPHTYIDVTLNEADIAQGVKWTALQNRIRTATLTHLARARSGQAQKE